MYQDKTIKPGDCFYSICGGHLELIKVVGLNDADEVSVIEIWVSVNAWSSGVYISNYTIKTDNRWKPLDAAEFESIYAKTYAPLRALVDEYIGLEVHKPDPYEKKIKYPKGQCFIKREPNKTTYFKLLNPSDYERVTSRQIFVCSRDNHFGVYVFGQCRHSIDDSCIEMNRKEFTKIWRDFNTDFDSLKKMFYNLEKELRALKDNE